MFRHHCLFSHLKVCYVCCLPELVVQSINSDQLAHKSQIGTDLYRTSNQGGIMFNKEHRTTHKSKKLRDFGVIAFPSMTFTLLC